MRVILSAVLICLGIIATAFGGRDYLMVQETIAEPLGQKVILIDPGHGGIDKGASEGDAIEKELNLKISMLLKSYIETNGGICCMTRTEDKNTADPNREKSVSQKMSATIFSAQSFPVNTRTSSGSPEKSMLRMVP